MRLPRFRFRTGRFADWSGMARTAQARGDWAAAANALAHVAAAEPDNAAVQVQLAHMLKEAGRTSEAAAAYRRASGMLPGDVDVRLHWAAMVRDRGTAQDAATIFAEILSIQPDHVDATRALAELGERTRLPRAALSRAVHGARLDAAAVVALASERQRDEWLITGAFPPAAFDLFRHRYPVPPPPRSAEQSDRVEALVLATGASAAMLRVTLEALSDQTVPLARIAVVAPSSLRTHPVASPGVAGVGVDFLDTADHWQGSGLVLLLVAGTIPDPQAVAWLTFARQRTGCEPVYADHDHRRDDWRHGPFHADPVLFGAHDPLALATAAEPPVMLLVAAPMLAEESRTEPVERLRALAIRSGAVHVPRLLASQYRLPEPARHAPADDDAGTGEPPAAVPMPRHSAMPGTHGKIAVIVPTLDPVATENGMIASLRRHARHPDRIHYVMVDNGPQSAVMPTPILPVRADRSILSFGEPFNWSRANNRGAAAVPDSALLVFVNDDMTMLTPGWDMVVERRLAEDGVGAMGAALFYPDGAFQHAGIVLGVGDRAPTAHEGAGHPGDAAGPAGRWTQARTVSAVTGAFLAMPRTVFAMLGGYEERLAIAYNDIDFCLRVREAGQRVVYDPAVRLTHDESRTRGRNVTRDQIAWDEAELTFLARRWGAAMRTDPGYNPQWALRGVPFDGYREPALSEVVGHIDAHAGGEVWRVRRIDQPGPDSACRL